MNLSEKTMFYLKETGWDYDRVVDITSYENKLSAEGYTCYDIAKSFLKLFGGLILRQPAYRVPNTFKKLHFDPIIAVGNIFKENVESYEKKAKEGLVVIGEAYNGYLTLMMSEKGKIYGAYDSFLTLLGNNYEEALESLFHCKETPVL